MACGCGSNKGSCSSAKPTAEELAREAEDCLIDHVNEQAHVLLQLYGGLTPANRDAVLSDRRCVRYPVRVCYDGSRLEPHQFAQPFPEGETYSLHLHPALEDSPQAALSAIAYMLPLINYGEVIEDKHCIEYGAQVLGIPTAEYLDALDVLAGGLGLEERLVRDAVHD